MFMNNINNFFAGIIGFFGLLLFVGIARAIVNAVMLSKNKEDKIQKKQTKKKLIIISGFILILIIILLFILTFVLPFFRLISD